MCEKWAGRKNAKLIVEVYSRRWEWKRDSRLKVREGQRQLTFYLKYLKQMRQNVNNDQFFIMDIR